MNSVFRKSGVIVLAAAGMSVAVALPASASGQDGLVNVATGDITILKDVNVAAVVPVVAQLCNLNVSPSNIAVLSAAVKQVDKTGKTYTVCKAAGGDVKIVQN
jgi:hypothetical protein